MSVLFEKPLPRMLVFLLGGIFLLNALATYFFWYWKIPPLDMLMHFAGGFWIGGTVLWAIFYGKNRFCRRVSKQSRVRIILAVLSAVLLVGLSWEIFEFALDYFSGRTDYDIIDTASDLSLDMVGGFIASLYFLKIISGPKEEVKNNDR